MPITPAEFEKRMNAILAHNDPEMGHIEADKLMCEILTQYGYDAGVKIFTTMTRWYS